MHQEREDCHKKHDLAIASQFETLRKLVVLQRHHFQMSPYLLYTLVHFEKALFRTAFSKQSVSRMLRFQSC